MMKILNDLFLLGDFRFYVVCELVLELELFLVKNWVVDLYNVMQEIRVKYWFGRVIVVFQLGIMKCLIYMNIDKLVVFINFELVDLSGEMFEFWDDCMSFFNLFVKVSWYQLFIVCYLDENWVFWEWKMEGDLFEFL